MSTEIGIAVVGVGRWGVHLVRNFLKNPRSRVVAIVDRNPERLAAVKQQLQLDGEVVLATDWAEVGPIAKLKAVAIATPASTHYPLIADALERGYHVLAEKPLTLNPADALKLCQLAEKQQRQLVVDHTYLFHPAVWAGQQLIQAGRLGELRYGHSQRTHLGPVRADVDVLWDLAVHDICIFNSWLGQLPTQVRAIGTVWLQGKGESGDALTQGSKGVPEYRSNISPHLSVPASPLKSVRASSSPPAPLPPISPAPAPQGLADLAWITLTYPSGFQAFIHLCWCNPDKQRRLVIVGSQGTLIFQPLSASAPLSFQHGVSQGTHQAFTPASQHLEAIATSAVEPLAVVCDRFLDCVALNAPSPLSSGWVGLQLVEILAACSESMKQGGQPVQLC